jgi:hypothetical protein
VLRQIQISDLFASFNDSVERLLYNGLLDLLAVNVADFEVVYFHQIRVLPGRLLIPAAYT